MPSAGGAPRYPPPMDVLSRLDLFALGRDYMEQRAKRLAPGTVDTEGSDANLFVGTGSYVSFALSLQTGERLAALTLDGAEGEDLDRFAWDRYREKRKGASASVTTCSISRTSLAAGEGTVDVGHRVLSLTGIEFVTTSTASFGASTYTTTCDVRSTRAGCSQNVGKNQIRTILDAGTLWDPSLTITNPQASAHGDNREEDGDFKRRIRTLFRTARRGTLAAIEQGALAVEGIASASAVEVLDPQARPARVVNLYIADGAGNASRALANVVDAQLLEWRAGGIAVLSSTSLPQIVPVRMHLAFRAGVETSTLTETIRGSVLGYVNSLVVNQTLYLGRLQAVLARFADAGLLPKDSTFLEPLGDVVPAPGFTLRSTIAHVTPE